MAMAEGGVQFFSSIKTLRIKCYTYYNFITDPSFSTSMIYYKGTSGATENYVFPPFDTDHRYCKVISYTISVAPPTGIVFHPI